MMRALQIEGYSDQPFAKLVERPKRSPGPGEVRVRVTAAALNPLDAKLTQGLMQAWFPLGFPYVPGTDFAGIVDEVGESVVSFRNGDAVYGRAEPTSGGALAEFVTLPAELIARRPSGLDAPAAACLPTPAGVAHQVLFEVFKRPLSAPLLILGTGAVARAAWQLARGSGEVTVCGQGAARLANLGTQVIGARVIGSSSPELAVIAANSDFVFDAAGGDLQAKIVEMLSPGAHVAAIVTPVSEQVAKARGIKADFVVLATRQATLDRLSKFAANSELGVETAGSFTLEQAPTTFRAFVAGTLPGKHVMQGDDK
jgi:NADPH:quinone reductase-like Zn-dependent oxidoreductase